MKKSSVVLEVIENTLGMVVYIIPIVCACFIVLWTPRAYHEGHKLFVDESMDRPGFAHTEMVTITGDEAQSALKVGRVLEQQKLIESGITFAVKARLSGYSDKIMPGTFILSSDMTMGEMMDEMSRHTDSEITGQDGSTETGSGDFEDGSSSSEKENKDVWGQF